jgi:uncharacterized protein
MKLAKLSLLLLCCTFALQAEDTRNKLHVNGSSVLHKAPDKLTIKIGVVTTDKNVETAIKANNEKMQNVFSAIKKIGLTEKEYQTSSFTIVPQYSPPPKNPPPDWHATITGYEVSNTLTVHTNKLEIAGPIIDATTKQGANIVEDISFSIQDTEEAQKEAIVKAIKQARAYADAAVEEAGITLGDVLDLSLNPAQIYPRFMQPKALAFAAMDSNNPTPISPGDVEVSANVSVIYELRH